MRETIERFWETIPGVWNQLRCNVSAIAAEEFGISVEQFHILRLIRKGAQSVSELAEARSISRPAVSQAVDLLVEKGLISRRQDVSDRRFVQLRLTPEGDDLINRIFQRNRAWMAEKMAALSPEELETVIQGLETLKSTFINSRE